MKETNSPWVIDVEQSAFERDVIARSHQLPVIVDFWAPWCGPCRLLGPLLEKLALERAGGFVLAKVNVDQAQDLAMEFAVEAIPSVKAFKNGKMVTGFVGVLPEAALRNFLDRLCPSELDRTADKAAALEAASPAEAETLYRQVMGQQPDHVPAAVGLARVLLGRDEDKEAGELLARVAPGGDLSEEVDRLGSILSLRELAQGFGDEAQARKRSTSEPENARRVMELGCVVAAVGRYEEALALLLSAAEKDRKLAAAEIKDVMVKIFQIIGQRSPLADESRDKLSRLLY